MKKFFFNGFALILIGCACAVMDARASSERTVVVSGKITREGGLPPSSISVQVCESKAGFLVMREKVLSSVKVNADGTFETPPLRHRSNWRLIVRVDGSSAGLQIGTYSFDEATLDRSSRYASGHVYLDTSLRRKQNLQK